MVKTTARKGGCTCILSICGGTSESRGHLSLCLRHLDCSALSYRFSPSSFLPVSGYCIKLAVVAVLVSHNSDLAIFVSFSYFFNRHRCPPRGHRMLRHMPGRPPSRRPLLVLLHRFCTSRFSLLDFLWGKPIRPLAVLTDPPCCFGSFQLFPTPITFRLFHHRLLK